ncbi:MAG TPA: YwiC-like family protein [Gaiellaceae bacterium]|nr:YwiC-like family protein [Gaiellaceae bacterium]
MTSTNGGNPSRKRTSRPYRDTVLVYGGFAVVLVVIVVLTGGRIWWALLVATSAFIAAGGWTWHSLRARERQKS